MAGSIFLFGQVNGSPDFDTEDRIRDYYHYRMEDVETVGVNISFGLGELDLKANKHERRFDGSILYSPSVLKPDISYQAIGKTGTLSIRVHRREDTIYPIAWHKWKNTTGHEFQNEAEFMLPSAVPLNASIDFGLGEAEMDLTGLTINHLDINCSLGEMELTMDQPNKTRADFLHIDTGLGEFEGERLGNFRAGDVQIDVGMGSAEVDMRGHNLVDTYIDISVGLGSLELILPENSNIKISAEHNFLSSVDVYDLVKKNGRWQSEEWNEAYPTFLVDVDVGIGSIEIRVRD